MMINKEITYPQNLEEYIDMLSKIKKDVSSRLKQAEDAKNICVGIKSFNVIIYDINKDKFISYDVIPRLLRAINEDKKVDVTDYSQVRQKIISESMYLWWSKCEYEVILTSWPNESCNEKIDVYYQVMLNLDIITDILYKELNKNKNNARN